MIWDCPPVQAIRIMNKQAHHRTILNSLCDAVRGIWDCIKMERNMRIHLSVTGYIIFLAFSLQLTHTEIAMLFITIAMVISLEMINTAIEKLCDFNQREISSRIRVIKDISAGAVLIAALFAVCVGVAILWRPSLWALIVGLVTTPGYLVALLCTLAAAFIFIFVGPVKIWNRINCKKK